MSYCEVYISIIRNDLFLGDYTNDIEGKFKETWQKLNKVIYSEIKILTISLITKTLSPTVHPVSRN